MPARFRYCHVELDGHELLLAEGVPAESYLATTEPLRFDTPPPVREPPAEMGYPRVKCARQLPGGMRVA